MAFAPTDGTVHMVYGIYFTRKGDRDAALEQYLEAQKLMPESVELHYNLGLLYTSLARYDDALSEAHQAYAGGFPLMGLKNKLMRLGVWRDPPAAAPAPVDAGTAPADGSDAATSSQPAGDASVPAQPHASDSDSEGQ
jgi:Flp pilus assembly protein TadD